MFKPMEIRLSTELIERKGGKVFRVYSHGLCIALCGLVKGEDGERNILLMIPPKGKQKGVSDHTNCSVS